MSQIENLLKVSNSGFNKFKSKKNNYKDMQTRMSIKSLLLTKVMPKIKEKYRLRKENNLPRLMDLILHKYQH